MYVIRLSFSQQLIIFFNLDVCEALLENNTHFRVNSHNLVLPETKYGFGELDDLFSKGNKYCFRYFSI